MHQDTAAAIVPKISIKTMRQMCALLEFLDADIRLLFQDAERDIDGNEQTKIIAEKVRKES